MPRKPKLREDVAETAYRVLQEAIGEHPRTLPPGQRVEKHPEAVKQGKKGGKARAKSLTKDQRSRTARRAAKARWKDRE